MGSVALCRYGATLPPVPHLPSLWRRGIHPILVTDQLIVRRTVGLPPIVRLGTRCARRRPRARASPVACRLPLALGRARRAARCIHLRPAYCAEQSGPPAESHSLARDRERHQSSAAGARWRTRSSGDVRASRCCRSVGEASKWSHHRRCRTRRPLGRYQTGTSRISSGRQSAARVQLDPLLLECRCFVLGMSAHVPLFNAQMTLVVKGSAVRIRSAAWTLRWTGWPRGRRAGWSGARGSARRSRPRYDAEDEHTREQDGTGC